MKKLRSCKACKTKLAWGFHGEQHRFLFWTWWVYWCNKCYSFRFSRQISKYPDLVEKWNTTHGRTL